MILLFASCSVTQRVLDRFAKVDYFPVMSIMVSYVSTKFSFLFLYCLVAGLVKSVVNSLYMVSSVKRKCHAIYDYLFLLFSILKKNDR